VLPSPKVTEAFQGSAVGGYHNAPETILGILLFFAEYGLTLLSDWDPCFAGHFCAAEIPKGPRQRVGDLEGCGRKRPVFALPAKYSARFCKPSWNFL